MFIRFSTAQQDEMWKPQEEIDNRPHWPAWNDTRTGIIIPVWCGHFKKQLYIATGIEKQYVLCDDVPNTVTIWEMLNLLQRNFWVFRYQCWKLVAEEMIPTKERRP